MGKNYGKLFESVSQQAFLWCENLKIVNIPEGVTSIEEYAFLGCESLKTITMLEEVEKEIMDALGKYGLSDTWGESDPDGIVTLTKQQ